MYDLSKNWRICINEVVWIQICHLGKYLWIAMRLGWGTPNGVSVSIYVTDTYYMSKAPNKCNTGTGLLV